MNYVIHDHNLIAIQINFFNSLYRSKEVLIYYFCDQHVIFNFNINKKQKQKILLLDLQVHNFWNDIDDAKKILNLIFEQQKMLKFNKTHLRYVIQR